MKNTRQRDICHSFTWPAWAANRDRGKRLFYAGSSAERGPCIMQNSRRHSGFDDGRTTTVENSWLVSRARSVRSVSSFSLFLRVRVHASYVSGSESARALATAPVYVCIDIDID